MLYQGPWTKATIEIIAPKSCEGQKFSCTRATKKEAVEDTKKLAKTYVKEHSQRAKNIKAYLDTELADKKLGYEHSVVTFKL